MGDVRRICVADLGKDVEQQSDVNQESIAWFRIIVWYTNRKLKAERLSEEEIGGLRHLFKMIDTDNSGAITFEELKNGLKTVGSNMMKSKIRTLMDAANIDNSGTVDYGEFLAATLHMNKMEREENLLAALSFFDKDGSGYITIDELLARILVLEMFIWMI